MIEARAACGETINVRRLDDRIAITAQLGAQVVRDDEEDVVLWSLRRGNRLWRRYAKQGTKQKREQAYR